MGLKEGKHEFQFNIDKDFFQVFEASPISEGDVLIKLIFEKNSSFFELHFEVDGTVNTECDRCAEDFALEIFADYDFFVKFRDEEKTLKESEAEVIWINRNDTHLDFGQLIYEMIVLSIPMSRNCGEPGPQNPKCVLKDLSVLSSLVNDKEEKEEQNDKVDPRWEALKKLKENKN